MIQYIVNLNNNNEIILNTKEKLEEEIRKMIIIIKNIDDLKNYEECSICKTDF